jgi:hypothetical protein
MPHFEIDLSTRMNSFKCPHCGEQSITVWGSVAKDNSAHAVYFANLMTGHEEASARISISIGGWGEKEGKDERVWVFIEVRPTTDNCEMMVRDLEESIYFGKDLLGRGMSRQEALKSDLLDDFFSVADHIVANDPAVKSYLLGERVSAEGRDHLVQ